MLLAVALVGVVAVMVVDMMDGDEDESTVVAAHQNSHWHCLMDYHLDNVHVDAEDPMLPPMTQHVH